MSDDDINIKNLWLLQDFIINLKQSATSYRHHAECSQYPHSTAYDPAQLHSGAFNIRLIDGENGHLQS